MKDIGEKLIDRIRREDGFSGCHLNYTGGTKAMAVHAYRKLEQVLRDECTFSYLSGRDFKLKDDQDGDVTGDLRKEINIGLDTLMELHGYEKDKDKDKEKDNSNWPPELLNEFMEFIAQNKLGNYLDLGKNFKDYVDAFVKNAKNYNIKLNQNSLYGKCLEVYVHKIVADNVERIKQEEKRDIPVAGNWHIKKNRQEKTFELDVIVLNGYQVTGISVTTSGNEKSCKEKGFEVLHRVNQIGGEEGKAILVTCLDKSKRDRVAEELRLISGSAEDKLEVLGMEDLPEEKLWKKVSQYIWGEVR